MIKAIGKFVILKGTTKKSAIILADKVNKSNLVLEKIEVYSVGDGVKSVKKGDEVAITHLALTDLTKIINPFQGENKKQENEFYISVKSDEIIGIF